MASISSKRLFIVFMTMLSIFFLALIFQNFSFKKDDHGEVYGALQGAISTSDQEQAQKRKFAEPEQNKGRRINTIQDNAGMGTDEIEPMTTEVRKETVKE